MKNTINLSLLNEINEYANTCGCIRSIWTNELAFTFDKSIINFHRASLKALEEEMDYLSNCEEYLPYED